MRPVRKITVDVDEELLKTAQSASQESISETVRLGLRLLAASQSFQKALLLKGRVQFSKSWLELKDDR
ncbi:MAG: hypothetical protein NTV34_20380 [Proteobacteria bacterium]|nr:hypothetical protein [Pseudomonadota bacterium]